MCENCTCQDQELEVTENATEELEYVGEQMSTDDRIIELEIAKEEMRIDKELIIEGEDLEQLVNSEKFQDGLSDGAYFSGFFTSLLNVGMPVEKAYEMCINQQTALHNLESAKINKEMNIEMSKNQSIQIDKSSGL